MPELFLYPSAGGLRVKEEAAGEGCTVPLKPLSGSFKENRDKIGGVLMLGQTVLRIGPATKAACCMLLGRAVTLPLDMCMYKCMCVYLHTLYKHISTYTGICTCMYVKPHFVVCGGLWAWDCPDKARK